MSSSESDALKWTLAQVAAEEHKAKKLLARCFEAFCSIKNSNLARSHDVTKEMIALLKQAYPDIE